MVKIKLKFSKSIKERINERDVKSKTKRNLKLDEMRCGLKQPLIVLNNKRPLASPDCLGKRPKIADLSYRLKSDEEDEETFRVDVARDIRRQEEKEISTRHEKDKTKMSAKDLRSKLADIEDENKLLKVRIKKIAKQLIKKNRKINRQSIIINQFNSQVYNDAV